MTSSNTNNSFEKIISDAYKHGEFEQPVVHHSGDVIDIRDMENPSGSDIVHRKFGNTTLREAHSSEGMRITQLNDGEVNMVEQADRSRITTREGDNAFEVTTPEGETHRIVADDTLVALNLNLPEID